MPTSHGACRLLLKLIGFGTAFWHESWNLVDFFIVIASVFEVAVYWAGFWHESWNLVDFFIVIASVFEVAVYWAGFWHETSNLSVLRLVRVFRIVRQHLIDAVPYEYNLIAMAAGSSRHSSGLHCSCGPFSLHVKMSSGESPIQSYSLTVVQGDTADCDHSLHVSTTYSCTPCVECPPRRFTVMACGFFGNDDKLIAAGFDSDAYFGTFGRSLLTMFQIMMLDQLNIIRTVGEVHPGSQAFFVVFICISAWGV